MLATRALLTGSFAAVPVATVAGLGLEGFWNDINDPRAIHGGGTTYVAYVQEDGDVHVVALTDGVAGAPAVVFSGDTDPSGNIHHSVAVCRRASDGRLVVAYAQEGDDQLNVRISTDPDDVSSWGSVIGAGATSSYTYVSLYQLDGGDMYLFTKRTSGWVVGYCRSTDGGATWGSFVPLLASGGKSTYWRAGCDGSRVDLFVTDTDRSDGDPSSVWHCWLDASEVLRESDGTSIGAASGGPYDVSDGTLVKDDSDGPVRCQGWAYDPEPACLLMTYADGSNVAHVARWTGSGWALSEVADVGGVVGGNRYISSGAMDKADPDTVYLPTKAGSFFELYRYRRSGGTWHATALTSGSSGDHAMPDTPLGADPAVLLVAGVGTYSSDSDFGFEVERYGY